MYWCSSETVPSAAFNKPWRVGIGCDVAYMYWFFLQKLSILHLCIAPWGVGVGADFGQLIVSAVGVAPHLKETQFCTKIIFTQKIE